MTGYRSPFRPANSSLALIQLSPPKTSAHAADDMSIINSSKITFGNIGTNKERRTEKSVRFASDNESLSYNSSADSLHPATDNEEIITWMPSELLYDDTFTSESQNEYFSNASGSKLTTTPSYSTNTFVDVESEDETRTLSEYSYTDSFVSSGVFSSHSQSDETTFREWGHGMEIVRDIEDLKESDFVSNLDHLQLNIDQEEETDIMEPEDEETMEISQQNFLLSTIRRLKNSQSVRSLDKELQLWRCHDKTTKIKGSGGQEERTFCQRMITSCQRTQSSIADVQSHSQESKRHLLEHYGLSSGIIEKLKTDSFQHWLKKKLADMDKEIEKSLEYIQNNQHLKDTIQKEQFIKQMKTFVLKENMEDSIQAHLIRMQPVKCFADFINELPKFNEDTREILYEYRRQVKNRISETGVQKEY